MNGGAMGYYADKAMYGKEQARKKMMNGGSYNKMI